MKKFKGYLLLSFFGLFLAATQTASAQATLSIQGILRKSSGAAVDDGTYSLTFKLYTTTSGGTAVHTETQSVSVAKGIYSTELGSGTPLNAAFDQTYYLGVSIDGGTELVPRARLTSSPYALALIGTGNLFPSSGAIGAGTITPIVGYQLHVKNGSGVGKMLVEGSTAAQIDLKKGSTLGSIGYGTANNDLVVNPGANNTTLQYNGTTQLTVNSTGVSIPGTLSAGTLTMTSDLTLPAGKKIIYGTLPDWRLVEVNNFESSIESWQSYLDLGQAAATSSPVQLAYGGTYRTGNALALPSSSNASGVLKKQFSLAGVPHTQVKVVFTLLKCGTPDGEKVVAGFAPSLTNTTSYEVGWESEPMYNLVYQGYFGGTANRKPSGGIRAELIANNSLDTFVIFVTSGLNEAQTEESFAIDNVEIWVK